MLQFRREKGGMVQSVRQKSIPEAGAAPGTQAIIFCCSILKEDAESQYRARPMSP